MLQANRKHDLATILADFANLYSSAEAIARFQQRWPAFLPTPPVIALTVEYRKPSGEVLSLDVPKGLQWIIWLRDIVRYLWIGHLQTYVASELEQILLSGKLGTTSTSPAVKGMWIPHREGLLPGIIGIDWKRRMFVYRPQTLLQEALYYLLQESDKAKVCGNADCPAPYFIAPRTNTRYCSDDCVLAMKRQAKRDWWEKTGQEWRHKRQSRKAKQTTRKNKNSC
jgi:hypothetical protein